MSAWCARNGSKECLFGVVGIRKKETFLEFIKKRFYRELRLFAIVGELINVLKGKVTEE